MTIRCSKCNHENPDDTVYCGKCGILLKSLEDISVTKTLETPVQGLSIGTTFAGRYQIIEELGKGGMGAVYKALDIQINEEVAIKLIRPDIASDEKTIERFSNELKLARKISHKNVCRMYHLEREGETPYISMEHLQGEDLKDLIQKKEKLTIEEAIGVAKQVCEGLAEAHRLGVVHRDLKPQNIMVDKEGIAKIMDFGIARSVEAPGVTATGVIIGTPDYISPEQAEGQEADHRSDIYSLGVILYEMVTGSVPFKGDTALSVALKHKSQLPLDPRKINPAVSDELSRLILVCMEKDRERRYQSAEALLDDLRNIEEGLPLGTKIKPRRATSIQTLIQKKFLIPTSVVILAIIAVAIWQLLPQKEVPMAPKIENSIAVISFENLTADKNLDDLSKLIPHLIISNLENADLSYVVSWERMLDICKQMGKENVEFIDSDLGFEICRREGAEALITGSLARAGDTFTIVLRMLDVETKKHLMTANSRGEGEASIINTQIDELSREIAQGIGIDKQSVEEAQFRVRDVTTNSIPAYEYYLKGREEHRKFYYDEAISYYKKAIELDPSFAMAYFFLGRVYDYKMDWEGGQLVKERDEAFVKAKEFSTRSTEKERLLIEIGYAKYIEKDSEKWLRLNQQFAKKYPREKGAYLALGSHYQHRDHEKALEMFNKVLELDPNDRRVHNDIGLIYLNVLHDYEKARTHFSKYVAINPNESDPLDSLARANFRLGRVDEALSNFEAALEFKPDYAVTMRAITYLSAFKEDYDQALARIEKYMATNLTNRAKVEGHMWKGFFYSWLGRYDEGFDHLTKAKQFVEEPGSVFMQCMIDFIKAQVCRERGQTEQSRKLNEEWYPIFKDKYPNSWLQKSRYFNLQGLLDLQKGNLEAAKSRLAEAKSLLKETSNAVLKIRATYYYNILEGEVLLAEGHADEAISLYKNEQRVVSPGIANAYATIVHNIPFIRDQLARAYLQAGDLDKAIKEYERLISDDRTQIHYRMIHPLYYYRVAILYEQKGWEGKAIENYEKFLTLYKDADPGITEVEDARKRLVDLKAP